jgi:hypothetical protein
MGPTAETVINVPDWDSWSHSRGFVSRELRGVDQANLKVYFQALHGLSEAVFRRSLLVGLRMHHVQFKDAKNWLRDHDETPDRKEFPKKFDRLYSIRGTSWAQVTGQSESFRCALSLWHDYSKTIRNHLAHAIRSYADEWLACAIQVDQILIMDFDLVMEPVIGGSLSDDLTKLVPRLPKGIPSQDLPKITGVKERKPRPTVLLGGAQVEVLRLIEMRSREVHPNR